MKSLNFLIVIVVMIFSFCPDFFSQVYFSTSLHKSREGFSTAYSSENGGMELITNIPISQLSCQKCHSTTGYYANGYPINPNSYSPICVDCHDFANTPTVPDEVCLNCHHRQKEEINVYPNTDVHKLAGLTCINCHSKEELHGDDAIFYSSLKEMDVIKVKCEDCHPQPGNNGYHNNHLATVDCSACHAVSVLTCAGCHFETFIATGKNRMINVIKDYRFLVKKDGKIKLGGIVTHNYNNKTNYIISSYHSHIIVRDAVSCNDCHRTMGNSNDIIKEYNNTGFITLATWDSTSKTIIGPNGIVPLTADWQTSLKVDHVTYAGNPNEFPTDPQLWEYLKSETDNSHLYFSEPLDSSSLAKLGITRFPVINTIKFDPTPTEFELLQNYPNPFNSSTKINFTIPGGKNSNGEKLVTLKVYDLLGKEVFTLVNTNYTAGEYEIEFNADEYSSGIFFYKLQAGNFISIKKMILLK